MPPSSLDLDRSASAVRSGRRGMQQKFADHTETSPAMTAGDIDADWESAYAVGDEAPGGDNPTPDQDIVDDIGRAVGVEYQDNEELKGERRSPNATRTAGNSIRPAQRTGTTGTKTIVNGRIGES